ncbi:MAG: hypothetical protein IJ158_10825 [Treponema sp.]|nr:hypothetical protein [Treponema sp.]
MSRGTLERAHSLLQRRKFSHVISLLESGENPEIYRESFDYFITAGIACLYLGDTGSAGAYFQRARRIRLTDSTLLCAQAVLFLRRGDTARAIEYYVDVLDAEPDNKIALSAMEFIRTRGTYDEVNRAIDSGEIEKFYPPLGPNPDVIKRIFFSALAGIILALLIFNIGKFFSGIQNFHISSSKERPDLSGLFLTVDDLKNSQKNKSSAGTYTYFLSDDEIKKSYGLVKKYSTDYKENAARVEINRLLLSNADESTKANLRILLTHFGEHTFDSLSDTDDNIAYRDVAKEPDLYLGCIVSWSGRVSNGMSEGNSYRCDLLVGYEKMERVEGFVPLFFEEAPYPAIDVERAVTVLGKIEVENGKILLKGRAIYQPIKQN